MSLLLRLLHHFVCNIMFYIWRLSLLTFLLVYLYHIGNARYRYWDNDAILIAVFGATCKHYQFILLCCKGRFQSAAYRVLNTIVLNGWFRVFLVVICLTLVTGLVLECINKVGTVALVTMKDVYKERLEENIIAITEDRNKFENVMIHPSTAGQRSPVLFHQMYRYRLEDVKMKCSLELFAMAGAHPSADQIVWRLNGAPLKMSDRHFHRIKFKDVTDNHTSHFFKVEELSSAFETIKKIDDRLKSRKIILEKIAIDLKKSSTFQDLESINRRLEELNKEQNFMHEKLNATTPIIQKYEEVQSNRDAMMYFLGQRKYQINSTLTIRLLQKREFGSYTCHVSPKVNIEIHNLILQFAKHKQFLEIMESIQRYIDKKYESNKTQESKKNINKKNRTQESPKCTNMPDVRHFFQDEYNWQEEFRLIEIQQRQEVISVPPGAILSLKTRYWHYVSDVEDVNADYFINGDSYLDICPGLFHGCSKFLLLYWSFYHNFGTFGIPPLKILTLWSVNVFPLKEYYHVHCMCENSYGYHRVKYVRNYYNRSSNKNDLIEIHHPYELVVFPRAQDMLSVYWNTSASGLKFKKHACVAKACCASPSELHFLEEYAFLLWSSFDWWEIRVLLFVAIVLLCLVFVIFKALVAFTRWMKSICLLCDVTLASLYDVWSYDVYLSYSDADVHEATGVALGHLEEFGLKVYIRDRDSPPNMPETSAWTRGIENSNRFIVVLSLDGLEDGHRELERNVIIECVLSRSSKSADVLVIRLDNCQIPRELSTFPVHDWSVLSTGARSLNLKKWAAPHLCSFFELHIYDKLQAVVKTSICILICLLAFLYCCVTADLNPEEVRKWNAFFRSFL